MLIARKLMLLDYVLDHPATEWIATQQATAGSYLVGSSWV
jgi:hypothetical protein